jgi:hypothetical protein
VVIDFSTVKKTIKKVIDDPEKGFDHKLWWFERIKCAVEALDIDMSLEQWYRIFIASKGKDLP